MDGMGNSDQFDVPFETFDGQMPSRILTTGLKALIQRFPHFGEQWGKEAAHINARFDG